MAAACISGAPSAVVGAMLDETIKPVKDSQALQSLAAANSTNAIVEQILIARQSTKKAPHSVLAPILAPLTLDFTLDSACKLIPKLGHISIKLWRFASWHAREDESELESDDESGDAGHAYKSQDQSGDSR